MPSVAKTERNQKIVRLYDAGHSRRAIGEAFSISLQRVTEILETHAYANGLEWPRREPRKYPNQYRPIPPEEL